MKLKPTMTIFVCVLAAGLAAAQSPISVIQNTRATMNAVRDNSVAASNAALGIQEKTSTAASAAHAPAKPGGTPVAVKVSSAGSDKAGANKTAAGKASGPKPAGGAAAAKSARPKAVPVAPKINKPATSTVAGNSAPDSAESENPSGVEGAEPDKWGNGKRDPFISPVVSHAGTPGCSTGKKCLEIGTISLRGIVRAESGFIAVVSNGLNKAYFLRENDPVFNGYVMKITGDSIVFQETLQDRLGKSFTREVVKKITTPAV